LKVTEILAIYAALLSTIVFVWNIIRATPRVKIEVIFGTDKIDGEYVSGIYISVKNPSPHTVHLSDISILYPYKKNKIFELITYTLKYRWLPLSVDDRCPLALESGKSHGILVPESTLEKIFEDSERREIKAVVQDQLWRNKYSRKFKYPKTGVNES